MQRTICSAFLLWWIAACYETKPPSTPRAEIRRISGDVIEIVPTAGQFPYCLAFTSAKNGVIRQLTIARDNKSVRCEPGIPIGRTSYKIPREEGPVKVHLFFSDRKLDATSVAAQIGESIGKPDFNPINFRLPGKVYAETLDFAPGADSPPTVGAVVNRDSQAQGSAKETADAGSQSPSM